MGKSLGCPLHALLSGAFRDQIKAYGTGCYYPDFFTDTPKMLQALENEGQKNGRPAEKPSDSTDRACATHDL